MESATRTTGTAWAVYNPVNDTWWSPDGESRELTGAVLFEKSNTVQVLVAGYPHFPDMLIVPVELAITRAWVSAIDTVFYTKRPGVGPAKSLFRGG